MPDVPDDYWLRRAGVFTEDDILAEWTPHDGGACPVAPDTKVAIRLRNATEHSGKPGWYWDWHRAVEGCESGGDVMAYRVLNTEQPTSPNDHYRQGEIECIDAIRAALTDEEWRGYCKGNVLKYVWRESGNETLVKAQDYLRWAVAGKAEGKR
jgi:hypothetical protein